MNSAPLLAFLGVLLILPRIKALTCQQGFLSSEYNLKPDEHVSWTVNREQVCQDGWGCQDTLLFIQNGPQVYVVLNKDCTQAADQESQVTEHSSGPGLSVISYHHVCRDKDLCNDLSNTIPTWAPSNPKGAPVPGGMQCPSCLSENGCLEVSETTLPCPAGTKHCYTGILTFSGGYFQPTNIEIQGCLAQEGCNLLNGTRKIGPIDVSENCNSNDLVRCHSGSMIRSGKSLSQEPQEWTSFSTKLCAAGEVCQETLLLIDAGNTAVLLGSKGCILPGPGPQNSTTISIHSRPPGVLVASYAHVCSSNGCNRVSTSSVLLNALPRQAVPDDSGISCPACVNFFGSCTDLTLIKCPQGATRCYRGNMRLIGGGIYTTMGVSGCMAHGTLLNNTQNIGVFSVVEQEHSQDEEYIDPPIIQSAGYAALK
ncbi:CD177 antigen [Echinops telfairi]|uniref:CD177 antigen n=1 Tax=Echinops telfairi TaxID=9371 RepID=A0AC55DA47_ECHTE|nr:CD177 antigen [Echinops telfairi]